MIVPVAILESRVSFTFASLLPEDFFPLLLLGNTVTLSAHKGEKYSPSNFLVDFNIEMPNIYESARNHPEDFLSNAKYLPSLREEETPHFSKWLFH